MAAASSKTVCLRDFNEDLKAADPWESRQPPPPPVPKRIAWPGGKIVSNKNEALASFFKRKLDQGQSLTPEQMVTLRTMVYPDESHKATSEEVGEERTMGGGGTWNRQQKKPARTSNAEARTLLYKLHKQVVKASRPSVSTQAKSESNGFASSGQRGRRKVNLSSLKQTPMGRGGSRSVRNFSTKESAPTMTSGLSAERRVVPDGRGGFTISKNSSDGATSRVFQQGSGGKRPRAMSEGMETKLFGKGSRLEGVSSVRAAVEASTPAVYREAESGAAAANGITPSKKKLKTAVMQNHTRGGKATGKKAFAASGGGSSSYSGLGIASGFGGGGAVAASVTGGVKAQRSLEDIINGGLMASRK